MIDPEETKILMKARWVDGMSFQGISANGFLVPLDAAFENGGSDLGFRPMELIALGLAGCTAMDVISILRKKKQKITSFEVRTHAIRSSEHPRVFTSASIEYEVTGENVDETAVRRALELSATHYCPAQAMLAKVFPIKLVYVIYEGCDTERRKLIKSEVFTP